MRVKLSHLVLLLLVFSLLTGSVGVAATQRFCAMLSTTAGADQKMEDMKCCSKKAADSCPEKAPRFIKKPCCTFSTTYQKLEVVSSAPSSKVQFPVILSVPTSFFSQPGFSALATQVAWPLYSDSSPPLAGRQLLQRLHILNI
ncbi:hypothetical protein [Rufibacter soli]